MGGHPESSRVDARGPSASRNVSAGAGGDGIGAAHDDRATRGAVIVKICGDRYLLSTGEGGATEMRKLGEGEVPRLARSQRRSPVSEASHYCHEGSDTAEAGAAREEREASETRNEARTRAEELASMPDE